LQGGSVFFQFFLSLSLQILGNDACQNLCGSDKHWPHGQAF
jgi:hypothetical protein